ncbi:MAG: hypothetical protein V7K26_32560 [Nostoc sp.]|uniref:hypothetical protein n=1 Tax=Nostoc sp. TaxID=1180 RepID=UPI002FF06D58
MIKNQKTSKARMKRIIKEFLKKVMSVAASDLSQRSLLNRRTGLASARDASYLLKTTSQLLSNSAWYPGSTVKKKYQSKNS